MHTPFLDTIKYFFLCLASLEIMHLFIRGNLNFTYILIVTSVFTILYSIDIRKPFTVANTKVEPEKIIQAEEKAL